MEKIYPDPEFGVVTLRKSPRFSRITLRVSPKSGILVSMPWLVRYREGLAFFESKRDWVRKVLERQAAHPVPELSGEEVERLRAEAKATLPPRLAELAAAHGFVYNSVRIKNNRSNWGSCSRLGNINLNLRLVTLPQELQDYVMLHELCHLRHPNHGPRFHALLETLCPNHRALQRQLRSFRLA